MGNNIRSRKVDSGQIKLMKPYDRKAVSGWGKAPGNKMDYSTELTTATDTGVMAAVMAFFAAYTLVILVLAVIMIVSMWKIFVKAGKPGWAALIPVYNFIVLLEIVGRPTWWVLVLFAGIIPVVGPIVALVASIVVAIDLAKSFGKDAGFGILLALLPVVGYPMLAFGKASYIGPSVTAEAAPAK